ncbi:MAG: T9SS type A sorting domain-containing protein [Sedimentisphaerales bacterium]|nr:T9SS type A sorting domain-containing protein [Sedimentisphaerales bacterium]
MKNLQLNVILCIILLFSNIHAQNEAIIDLDNTHQLIRGFGACNILQWRPDMTRSEIETAFGTGDGQLGFTILRLRIQPDSDQWITNVSTAEKAYNMGVTIIAAPWNPPEEMLDPDSDSRRLSEDWYFDYVDHLNDFIYFMEDYDVPIYAVSVQNEPDYGDWTRWTAGEMLTFMRDCASEIDTRVMAPESFQFRRSYSDPILNDSAACANLDILGGHIYGGGTTPYPLAESKGKEIWMTEHYTDSQNSGNLWPMALDVGTDIHRVMNAGMSAYVWWYIVRYYGPISDGTMDSGNKGEITKRGYIMSQYARFIRPGFYRIECNSQPQSGVSMTAYKNESGSKIVIVAVNVSSLTKNQTLTIQNREVEAFTPYVTSETKNCKLENDIPASTGSFSVTLDGQSVTTFVSSGDVTAVEKVSSAPATFRLYQNYPNPFNPSTQIHFEIPEKSFVSLKVYNILGEEIAELAGKEYLAGMHSEIFDASHLTNGTYLYTLRTNDFISTRKLLVMR